MEYMHRTNSVTTASPHIKAPTYYRHMFLPSSAIALSSSLSVLFARRRTLGWHVGILRCLHLNVRALLTSKIALVRAVISPAATGLIVLGGGADAPY